MFYSEESDKISKKRFILALALLAICLSQSGCALLGLPFKILGSLFQLIEKLPMPPPGVF